MHPAVPIATFHIRKVVSAEADTTRPAPNPDTMVTVNVCWAQLTIGSIEFLRCEDLELKLEFEFELDVEVSVHISARRQTLMIPSLPPEMK